MILIHFVGGDTSEGYDCFMLDEHGNKIGEIKSIFDYFQFVKDGGLYIGLSNFYSGESYSKVYPIDKVLKIVR